MDTQRLRRGLITAALVEQQDYSADPVQSWWSQVLDEGLWTGDGARLVNEKPWPVFLAGASLYETFLHAMKGAGSGRLGTRTVFMRRLRKLLPQPVEAGLLAFVAVRVDARTAVVCALDTQTRAN